MKPSYKAQAVHCVGVSNMVGSNDEPKLLVPALKPFYDFVIPLSWFVVRAAAGWNLLVHSWGKITVGPAPGFLKAFVDIGFTPPAPWFWTALFTETLAGIALILGLFTRFFAAAAAIQLLIITAIYWHNGFSWLRQGYEYTLLWGWICFANALRGGGPYSVDRAIGEL
jgi:putative oxidoreductase